MDQTGQSLSANNVLDFLKNISGPVTLVASATGFILCFAYCLQIRYFPAADFASLSGGFVAVALLAFLLLAIVMLPALAALAFLSEQKLRLIARSLNWSLPFATLGFAVFATVGEMSWAITLCLWLFVKIHTVKALLAIFAIAAALCICLLVLRAATPGVRSVWQFIARSAQSLTTKARVSAPGTNRPQRSFLWLCLGIVFVGGILLAFGLMAFVLAANQSMQLPVRAHPVRMGIRGLSFALSPFVFSGNYLATQWFVQTHGSHRGLPPIAGLVFGLGMIILISFGLPGKFLATLGLGDLYNCTIVAQQEAADTFLTAGYNPKTGSNAQITQVMGVHVLLAIGGSIVIAKNQSVLTFTRRTIPTTDSGGVVVILFPTLVDNVRPGEPSRAIIPREKIISIAW
jgi:hypothetical protein